MAIMIFSIVLSMVSGCVAWLVIGEKFPLNEDQKLPALNNIVIYTLITLVPMYLLIFVIFN